MATADTEEKNIKFQKGFSYGFPQWANFVGHTVYRAWKASTVIKIFVGYFDPLNIFLHDRDIVFLEQLEQ